MTSMFSNWRAGFILALVLPLWSPQGNPTGTFAFIDQKIETTCFYMVLNAEQRGEVIQITGKSRKEGKTVANFSGTYYPGPNEFRGVARTLTGTKKTEEFDGKFHPATQSYEFWLKEEPSSRFYAKRVDLADVEGSFSVGSLTVTIERQGTAFSVAGSYGGYPIRGSYMSRDNELAARTALHKIDGVYDPYTKGLYLWLTPSLRARSSEPGYLAVRGAKPVEIDVFDPALAPGAVWRQSETHRSEISGTWTYEPNGRTFRAEWANGAVATLKLEKFTATEVVVTRDDTSGVSIGLKARYEGKRTGKRVQGNADWTWANGTKGKGKWSAVLP